jgi:hypothetical protein
MPTSCGQPSIDFPIRLPYRDRGVFLIGARIEQTFDEMRGRVIRTRVTRVTVEHREECIVSGYCMLARVLQIESKSRDCLWKHRISNMSESNFVVASH